MSTIRPFQALRPQTQWATQVASKPYDVLSREEAKEAVQNCPYSFLHITKSEVDCTDDMHAYEIDVYEKAKENLQDFISKHILLLDEKPHYYIYELTMQGHSQSGLVCVSWLEDYRNGVIKKHELTRPEKEKDRTKHINITEAQTGNVFLFRRDNTMLDVLLSEWKYSHEPVYHFLTEDDILHAVWVVDDELTIDTITHLFAHQVTCTYIADGHHRAASAAKVAKMQSDNYDAEYFLTTIFPASQLRIMSYNRLVKDLNGLSAEAFIDKLKENFLVVPSNNPVEPEAPHEFGMYLQKKWYSLKAYADSFSKSSFDALDVNILQNNVLQPLLGIADQCTDERIGFVGGGYGLKVLKQRVDSGEMAVAFSLYPVDVDQLMIISDMGELMPPKSTWFEPKLRDGLFTHMLS